MTSSLLSLMTRLSMMTMMLLLSASPKVSAFVFPKGKGGAAFVGSKSAPSEVITTTTTSLGISSWGTKGSPYASTESGAESQNPEENIQAYLNEPDAVEARVNVDGTVMVSGLVNSKERTDQNIFDLVNHEESAFEFDKIVAFVDDVAFAKKRLLSRSARYTGLLNKLDFTQAESEGALPTLAQLEGVKSWIAYVEAVGGGDIGVVAEIAKLAQEAPSVENIAILLTNAVGLNVESCQASLDALQGGDNKSLSYTLVAVGKLDDTTPEGKTPYSYSEFGSPEGILDSDASFSREEAMRMVTECLQLECGVNKALSFSEVYDVNATEAKLIKGLRAAGYARPQEIDHMIRDGPKNYQAAIDDFAEKNPDYKKGYYTTEAWWEDEQFQKSVKKSSLRKEEELQSVKDARTQEVESIAKEWVKREFFRLSMANQIEAGMTEEEFTKSVWERAMFEGDLKYRQIHGETIDSDLAIDELEDFKARQERKKAAMLQRAKDELKELLDQENLGGTDLDEKLDDLDPDADNTEK